MISSEEIRLATCREAFRIAQMSRLYVEDGLGWAWTPARVAREIESNESNAIVAAGSGQVIGFGIMRYQEEQARLNLFAVAPEHRREGVGTRLIQWLEKTALVNGNGLVCLEARASNVGAVRFYQSVGYRVVERIPGYYRGRETAVRMAHDLWAWKSR